MLAFFTTVGMRLGLTTIAIAHITFCTAFVVLVVRARLHGFDRPWSERPWIWVPVRG